MFQAQIKSNYDEDISILLKLDNHPWNYLCECGDASDLTVKEVQNCNAIFISHTHIDHFVNFDAVVRHQIGIQRRVVICGPQGIAQQVQSRIKSYTWNLIESGSIIYEIHEMVSDDSLIIYEIEPPVWELKTIGEQQDNVIFKDKAFEVIGTLLDHKIPTLAYKFKEYNTVKIDIKASGFKGGKWVKILKDAFENNLPDTPITIENKDYVAKDLFHLLHVHEGDSVGVIMDHAAHAENHVKIKTHFLNCRQVFIECFYKLMDKAFAKANYHSYSTQSAKVMRKAGVKDPVPVHFSRKYTMEEVKLLIEEFETELNKQL